MRRVGSVEADNIVVLIFDPDAAQKTASTRVFLRSHINYDTANLTQKLATNKVEGIKLALEVLIENRHLGKSQRQKLHRVSVAHFLDDAFSQAPSRSHLEGT